MKIKKPKDIIIIWLKHFYTNTLLLQFLNQLAFGHLHLLPTFHVFERQLGDSLGIRITHLLFQFYRRSIELRSNTFLTELVQ